jgi:sugar phosphate isomerase/epimerase
LDLKSVLQLAKRHRLDGIDFRGIGQTLDVTVAPEFTTGLKESKAMIADSGLEVSGISTSINVCDPNKYKANMEEAKRVAGLALELGCPNIRVFGGGDVNALGRERCAEEGRMCLREILCIDGARWLTWLFETHDQWLRAADLKMLLDRVPDPSIAVLWDIAHAPRMVGETPDVTYAAIGGRVKYTHIKDEVHDPKHPKAMKDGWRYVPPGEGQAPLKQALKLLKDGGYDGWLTLEHEKRWHPELEEAEEILPKYVKWARETWRAL